MFIDLFLLKRYSKTPGGQNWESGGIMTGSVGGADYRKANGKNVRKLLSRKVYVLVWDSKKEQWDWQRDTELLLKVINSGYALKGCLLRSTYVREQKIFISECPFHRKRLEEGLKLFSVGCEWIESKACYTFVNGIIASKSWPFLKWSPDIDMISWDEIWK